MKLKYNHPQQMNGFTLIETMIAMVVLTIGIMSLYSMQTTSILQNSRASQITIASNWAAKQIEQIINTPYTDTLDKDDDGTGQDSDNDGEDDDGGNFGLDDITSAAKPDGKQSSPDGKFTLYWNVAIDHPLEGMKTIRVHVVDNNKIMKNVLSLNYIKQGPI